MPNAPATAAPPNFYDNLPAGGDAAAGGTSTSKKTPESDSDEELMKGFTGIYRVLGKMAKLKKELKPGIDDLKDKIKVLVVQGLKKDPKDLDSGDDAGSDAGKSDTAGTPPPAGGGAAPPSQTDESHAA